MCCLSGFGTVEELTAKLFVVNNKIMEANENGYFDDMRNLLYEEQCLFELIKLAYAWKAFFMMDECLKGNWNIPHLWYEVL